MMKLRPEPLSGEIELTALRYGMCRWPVGAPKDPGFGFCGRGCFQADVYCPTHMDMAMRPKHTVVVTHGAIKDSWK